MVNRGSEWRKWDLHIHSLKTHLNDQFKKHTEEEYLDAINDSDISVFGVTDYFTVDNQFDTIEKFNKKFPNSEKVFFVNIEFRLNENVGNNPSGHVNLHLIFDNKQKKERIESFINSLELTQSNPNGTKKKIIDLKSMDDFKSATIEKKEIIDGLKKFFGNEKVYLIVLAASGLGGIRPATKDDNGIIVGASRNGVLSDELDKIANFFFGDNQSREYFLDKNHPRYTGSKPKATIKGSDAHMLLKAGTTNGIGDEYSWIKAEPTFEGLRQILFEPEDRISLQLDKPERKNDYQVIDRIVLDDKKTLFLSPNLNTIIGGRSMGKSTLSNSIAKKLHNSGCDIETMHTYHEIEDETMKIIWKGGVEDDSREIEFLPQNHMIDLAEKPEKRKILIDSIIRSKDRGAQYQEISDYNVKISNNKSKISAQLQEYFDMKGKLSELIKPEGDESGILSEIEKLTNKQREKRKENNFSDEDAQKYDGLLEQLSEREKTKKVVEKNLRDLENLAPSPLSLNKDTTRFNKDFAKILSEKLRDIEEKVKTEWARIVSELAQAEETKKEDSTKEICEIQESKAFVKGKENISNNASLKELANKLKTENESLENLKKYQKDKLVLEEEIYKKQEEILESYADYAKFRVELEKKFNIKTEKVEIKLVFSPEEFLGEILNGRTRNALTFIEEFNLNSSDKIKHIFENLDLAYNGKNTQDDLIEALLSKDWYTYNFLLEYDDDDFDKMSQGKKAFVILNLILEFSDDKKPVIIDQPEDSLDNRAIFKDLTEYLIRKKKERQIILITHNPNVVVGADAENIIIANKHSESTPNENDREFDYINGALESIEAEDKNSAFTLPKQSVRDHMFEILEGGKEAFEKRENKYNL